VDQRGEVQVHLEVGELAPWAASVIAPLVKRVVCSHPEDNAWIAKAPTSATASMLSNWPNRCG
jgi:hypothetical protein